MVHQQSLAGILASFAFCALSVTPAFAQLPTLSKEPWIGYFAAHANKDFQLCVSSHGEILLDILNEKNSPMSKDLQIPILIAIQETDPSGKVVTKEIKAESLSSEDKPTEKLEKVTIKGKITGDVPFEVFVEQSRGVIQIGGRLTDPAAAKNPTRFNLQVRISKLYPNSTKLEKKGLKAFEKSIAGDRVSLKYTDGKRNKFKVDEKIDTNSAEFNGTGITNVETEFNAHKGNKLTFTSSPNAVMKVINMESGMFNNGFSILWTPDVAKDPTGKARLLIDVK